MTRDTGTPRKLRDLRARIESWRATRGGQGPMPEPLWAAAAEAARTWGISRVAKELNVGHAGLRRRAGGRPPPRVAAGFVEVTGAELVGGPAVRGTVIEYAGPRGGRLTVTVPVGSGVDVLALVSALRGP